jgi:hypothetical protein
MGAENQVRGAVIDGLAQALAGQEIGTIVCSKTRNRRPSDDNADTLLICTIQTFISWWRHQNRSACFQNAETSVLLAAALPSGDPALLEDIGQLQHMLHPQEPRPAARTSRLAWLYVACERGADCSGFGPSSPINCAPTDTQCLGVPAMMMLMAQNNWAPIQEEVNQINAKLDARQWTDLEQYIDWTAQAGSRWRITKARTTGGGQNLQRPDEE